MTEAARLVEVWRGDIVESAHRGHWVVADARGEVLAFGGEPDIVIYPRSSAKPLQALALVESGAADRLTPRHLALACASHNGAPVHSALVAAWLSSLGLGETDLRCGIQPPRDAADRQALRDEGRGADQTHNNCSGKHAGFLTLTRHLHAGPDYIDPDHPVQRAVRAAIEDMTGAASPGFGIDGCSAPNFACRLSGLARAMARLAASREDMRHARDRAGARLVSAMIAHPDLVAGERRACTRLIRALDGRGMVKTGAEGVFVAALRDTGLGIALKIEDGATRASEVAITALLTRFGGLDAAAPEVQALLDPPILNRRGIVTGRLRPAVDFLA